jgi:ribosomal protein S18 acetylase RimI-like enzyme
LAVYEKNQKAIDFYMKNGFEKTSPASPASETPESPKYLVMEWKK